MICWNGFGGAACATDCIQRTKDSEVTNDAEVVNDAEVMPERIRITQTDEPGDKIQLTKCLYGYQIKSKTRERRGSVPLNVPQIRDTELRDAMRKF